MCGIAGIITRRGDSRLEEAQLKKMTDAIAHRGPDGEGQWLNDGHDIALGHRRLSIIDVSEAGHQPMHYLGRYTITFNGEIYNYVELREACIAKGYTFRSHCDTEVIMAMYDRHGADCLQHFDGMFSFAIYDKEKGEVFCARDRFGEKPFYYAVKDGAFYFGSEMKVLWAGGIGKEAEPSFAYNYLAYGLVDNPADGGATFFKGIRKLPPAHSLHINCSDLSTKLRRYWDIDLSLQRDSMDEATAIATFKELFFTSVKRRLRSDVPLGSSLSGGLDSSVIVGAMDKIDAENHITRKTFSARFPGFAKDETRYQEMVTGATHVAPHAVYPDEASLLRNWESICHHQEEPFGSASINVQYEVYRAAKEEGVTVLLDGQGADEILAGYHGYLPAYFNELRRSSPRTAREQAAAWNARHQSNTINPLAKPSRWRHVKALVPRGAYDAAVRMRDRHTHAKANLSPAFYNEYRQKEFTTTGEEKTLNGALYYSTCVSGLQTLLRFADRNSMAHSREVRLPFLSHELVEFLFTLPPTFKVRDGYTKWLLRKATDTLLPPEIIWRIDKIGFEPPQSGWLSTGVMAERIDAANEMLMREGYIPKGQSNMQLAWRKLTLYEAIK